VYFSGLLVGVVAFLLIGAFHVVVIKGEYHFGKRIWPLFAVIGVVSVIASLFIEDVTVSVLVAVFGITCIWTIKELFEQEERVKKGWFPENPKRRK
jgi:steroid 5-alpha reductase family enzyme